ATDFIRAFVGGSDLQVTVNGQLVRDVPLKWVASFTLRGSGDAESIDLDSLPGTIPVAADSGGGNDAVQVILRTNDVGTIAGRLTLGGGAGYDYLTVNGQAIAFADSYTVTDGRVTASVAGSAAIDYGQFEFLNVLAGSGDSTVRLLGTPA